jgi:7,8-dihydropterin-6-yl-methyl-4-(beta-D-ribofuranosyl)aminobenzene 5'-phosphate synthase
MKRAGVGRVGRRDLVRGGGAIALAGALDALFAARMSSQAQQLPVSVPVVDRLAVRVLVDSYQIAVAPSFKINTVQVERFGWPLSDAPPDKALVCEFGLSMHVESRKGDQTRNVLVDFWVHLQRAQQQS